MASMSDLARIERLDKRLTRIEADLDTVVALLSPDRARPILPATRSSKRTPLRLIRGGPRRQLEKGLGK